ncbi:HemK2/MTQ2 family protein methyltransferase [Candidatus Entotheonella palauensis]|uniref:HemK2/MTQ2 family protein methyltransferase n=1 Tax=Candidatus Entotheonella palauensis TaxID=93172 RepID=UPI0015C42CF7|nr:HemK2/MTQ2 family protein methyltransferase [Candidatus Entotheonella palauensis]
MSQSSAEVAEANIIPRVHPCFRLLSQAGYSFVRPFLRRRIGRTVLEHVEGLPFLVLPDVFNPSIYRTGRLLVQALAALPIRTECGGEPRALDIGTGSGLGAIFAARRGYQVAAVDINPSAVRCARINALQHHLEDRIDVRQGDLFEPVQGERFDLVLFNPPFFRGQPRNALDAAWRGADVLERFAAGLPAVLNSGGVGLIVLSTDGDCQALLRELRNIPMTIEVVRQRHFGNEIITVYHVQLDGGKGAYEP